MPFRLRFLALLLSVLPIAACTPPAPTTTAPASDPDGGEAPSTPAATAAKPAPSTGRGLQVRPELKTFNGVWGLVLTQAIPDRSGQQAFRDLCISLFELKYGGEDDWSGEVLATLQGANAFKVAAVRVDNTALEIDFQMSEATLEFRGNLVDGVVRGTLTMPDAGITPAILRPTQERTFEGWDPMPLAAGMERFSKAMADRNQPQAMLDAANEFRGSVLSVNAYEGIIGRLSQYPGLDEAAVRGIIRDYVDMAAMWGPRLESQAKLNAALSVAMVRRFPELALELADVAEKDKGGSRANWQETLNFAREQAALDLGLKGLKSKDAQIQQKAFEDLQGLLSKQRYNPELLDALAIYADKTNQKPLAKQYFAEIVALPLLEDMWQQTRAGQPPGDPTPRERLLKLWEDEHGNLDGFDQFLVETHKQRMAELMEQVQQAGKPAVAADQQQRTVLVELFTGTACPPCVAGDVALSILRKVYPAPQAIVLQFHQHVPGPDPLTNLDSEDRFAYYEGTGTPTAMIDGQPLPPPGLGGILQHVERVYGFVRTATDARLQVPSAAKLTLSAKVEGDELVVEAIATDFPEDQAPNLRLRLAVAENHVDFVAPNGIREHEFVVREMLGGAKGTGVKSGRLTYSLRMPFADIKQHLTDYLAQFETGRDYTFLVKPLKLQELSLVGWVQNDETREVLNAAVTPVDGVGAAKE
ncbi:MAG TPA: hypothetical protein VM165_04520 [Planctomycetaceae bacterium]|nr:hypothetical protein [Planctomycetaceae bacterium]